VHFDGVGDAINFFVRVAAGLMAFAAIGLLLQRWRRKQEASHWPTVSCAVESVCADASQGSARYGPAFAGAILYSYKINGEYYSGQYYLPGRYSTAEDAQNQISNWIGKTIQVHYNPADPQESYFLDVYP
jgi:hypothetical protein